MLSPTISACLVGTGGLEGQYWSFGKAFGVAYGSRSTVLHTPVPKASQVAA